MAATLLFALGVGAPALKPERIDTDLVGVWDVLRTTTAGKGPPKDRTGLQYEFTADGPWLVWRLGTPVGKGPRGCVADPPAVDVTPPDGVRATTPAHGICKVEGNVLTICLAATGADRPTSFDPPADVPVTRLVLRRAKPKPGPGGRP